jgi:hypothetical protein
MSPARRRPAQGRTGPYTSPFLSPSQAPLGGTPGSPDNFALQSPFNTPAALARTQIPSHSSQSSYLHASSTYLEPLNIRRDFGTPAKSAGNSDLTFMRTPASNKTPLRPHLTPLNITKSAKSSKGVGLDRLAPTSFATRSARKEGPIDPHVHSETATMTHLRIKDLDDSDDDVWDDKRGDFIFSGGEAENALRSLRPKRSGLASDGPLSPDGHVTKRRMRTRQPSFEFDRSPSPSPQPTRVRLTLPALTYNLTNMRL